MPQAEILAPAGATEQLYAAVRCGANAVYLGGKRFNARRNAQNFDDRALSEVVSYCHARNVRVYVTINTLVMDDEFSLLEEEADGVAAAGADAVIIQDMAVLKLFENRYPAIRRYASTQTAVHNVDGARFLMDAGFESVVLARELTLDEMEQIRAAVPLKMEAFVHGAHCMSVSGACYLSAMLGGRSGNRGLCAQPCRLDWRCGSRENALSLKDMSLISHMRRMAEAGVDSFKIEGRMKRPEYVAAAVTACKHALAGEAVDVETLRAVFSRSGFTDGYLTGKRDASMFGSRTKEDVLHAERVFGELAALYKDETPLVPIDLTLAASKTCSRLVASDGRNTVQADGDAPEKAINRPLDEARARRSLEKTGGTPYAVSSFTARIGEGLSLSAASLNALRRTALDELTRIRSTVLPHERRDFAFAPIEEYRSPKPAPMLWARFYRADALPDTDPLARVILPARQITPALVSRYGGRLSAELPAVVFPDDEPRLGALIESITKAGLKSVWVNNIYGVELGKRLGLRVYGGFGLNVLNTEALAFYQAQGVTELTISFELSMAKIRMLGGTLPRGAVIYGKLPLMQFRACPIKAGIGCQSCGENGVLTDRMGIEFPVECQARRVSTLLNSVTLDILERPLPPLDHRLLYFTRESAAGAAAVIQRAQSGEKTALPHTGGLYYRTLL